MASTQRELEEELVKAGNSLLEPPSSDDELLPLLDRVENHLSSVEQSPSKSMQTALVPCTKALIANGLLRHPNVDVKVAVASCISEITRITAPDAPYDDDRMKDIFELIVSSFEDLSDKSSRSYSKRTMILETVAKVRSCVVMLDLECDGLIVKMFQHFLKSIRDYHQENVFASMETIMTLVLEESEDISVDLISPILSSLKKDNKDFPPIAQQLGEKVLENCAKKLKPCLVDAKKSLGLSWNDYSDKVASICDDAVRENNGETCDEPEVEESNLPKSSPDHVVPADDEKLAEASLQDENKEHAAQESVRETSPGGESPVVNRSGTPVLSNGISECNPELNDNITEASQKLDGEDQGDKPSDAIVESNEAVDLESGKIVVAEIKADQTSKRRGRRSKSSTSSAEPSESSRADGDKEPERLAEGTTLTEDAHGSPKDPPHEAALSSENEKEVKLSPPEELENEPVNAAPSSPGGSVLEEGRPKRVKAGRSKKKEKLIQDASPSIDVVSEKASEGANDSEVRPPKRSGKKVHTGKTSEEKASALCDTSKSKGVTTSDSEAKRLEQSGKKSKGVTTSDSEAKGLEQSGKKIDSKDNAGSEPSSKKEDKRKRGRGKTTSKKPTESSANDDDKETLSSPKPDQKDEDAADETPKVTFKRKRGQGKDGDKETPKPQKVSKDEDHLEETPKASAKSKRNKGKAADNVEYGANLVGARVQVWWPDDQTFYKGVIDSYDAAKRKHKVAYLDGEIENLNLRKEKWELIEGDSFSDEEQALERPGGQSPKTGDPSLEKPKNKKAKTESQASKQGKRAEDDPSSRSKRGSQKSKDEDKVAEKPKDSSAKPATKAEEDSGVKAKDKSKKSGGVKSGETSKSAGKSKDVDGGGTPKPTTKSTEGPAKTASKDTTPESAAKSKGKSPKSKDTDTNGSNKEKAAAVPGKAKSDGSKKTSSEKAKTPGGSSKRKVPEDTPKSEQQSEAKSGKKRGRVSKN